MDIIDETDDYGKFEQMPFNRNVVKIKDLEASMKKHGFLSPHPLHVIKFGNGKMRIKDGHHRFVVAKKLKIPVKYVVCNSQITMHELVKATVPWSINNFLDSFAREGNKDYLYLKNYCDETGIPIGAATKMFEGKSSNSGCMREDLKTGNLKIDRTSTIATDVKEYVLLLKNLGIPYYSHGNLVAAFSKIASVEEISKQRMLSKIKKNVSFFEKKATLEQYLELLEEIYNRQARDKAPLRFLVEKQMKIKKEKNLKWKKDSK